MPVACRTRSEQFVQINRLGKIIHRAVAHGADGVADVGVRGDEQDGQGGVFLARQPQRFQPGKSRHPHIGNHHVEFSRRASVSRAARRNPPATVSKPWLRRKVSSRLRWPGSSSTIRMRGGWRIFCGLVQCPTACVFNSFAASFKWLIRKMHLSARWAGIRFPSRAPARSAGRPPDPVRCPFVGREVRLEDFLAAFRRNAGAVVANSGRLGGVALLGHDFDPAARATA